MKLKKIASLMLAGVMAVSMLAGCSNGTKPDDGEKDPVVNTGLTGKVINALDADTTDVVTFSASSSLEAALQKAIKNVGTASGATGYDSDIQTALNQISDNYNADNWTTGKQNNKNSDEMNSKVGRHTWVEVLSDAGYSEEYAVQELAKLIDSSNTGADWSDNTVFPTISCDYTEDYDSSKSVTHWYRFAYTADVAVVEATDAVTGQTTYVVAYTVTRTPTKVEK